MPKVAVVNMAGEKVSDIVLSDAVFGIEPNKSVMHAAVVTFLANRRQGTQSALTRSEVSGGGKKPWRQKGTGHARQGSTRAPQWTHGGIALGPKPRDYSYALPKKVRRLALKSAFSAKVAAGDMLVLESLSLETYRTKAIAEMLRALGAEKKVLLVLPENDQVLVRSARNIPGVKTAQVSTLNTYDVINADKVIVVKDAVARIEEVYA